MGAYAGVTDNYLTQSDQTRVADAVKKYSLWAIGKEGTPGRRPGIDLNFAENKSLVDDVSGSNLVTFTRTSAATYVDSNGVIKTTPINLLPYSFDFSNWIEGNITLKSSNNLAPDGTLTASLIGDSTSVSTNTFLYYSLNVVDGNTYSYSFYAKSTTSNQNAFIDYYDAGTNRMRAYVSLDDGTVTYNQNTANGTVSSENAGNGWWRITHTSVPNGSSLFWWRIGNYATGDIYVWGAQLESGSSSSDYISTNSVASGAPRFDHDPVTGESLGLLIEESSTNEWSNSESLVGGTNGYTLPGGLTNPAGGTTAVKIPTGSTQTWWNRGTGGFAVTSGDYWTMSWWAYSTNQSVDFGNPDYFNVANTTISQDQTVSAGQWKRCYRTVQFTASGSPQIRFMPYNWTLYTNTNNEVFVWGFQFEKKAFPTSYIPTSGSTVTRSVDSALLSTSNWWDYTKGTAYAEFRGGLESNQGGYGRVWSPFTVATFISSNNAQNSNNRMGVWFGGTSVVVGAQDHLNSFAKNAITYSNNGTNCDIVNASYPSSATGTTNSCIDSASHGIGRNVSFTTNMLNGHIKRMIYWEQVLDPSTLQSLTE